MKIRKNILVGVMAALVGIFLLPSCASMLQAIAESGTTTNNNTNNNKKSTTNSSTGTSKSSGSTSKGRK